MTGPSWPMSCPLPMDGNQERITLAHGEGGRLSRRLINEHILPVFGNPALAQMSDAAPLLAQDCRLAVTTDSFVVSPLFFPGGDIGSLAVFGTVNDLLVSGAKPRWLTLSLIIEEGFPIAVLDRILQSAAKAATTSGVLVVAGDTKVVSRGKGDGLFVNMTGLGELVDPVPPGPSALEEGDELIVSGPIGQHGIAVLCARDDLGFDPVPRSDSAPLTDPVAQLREAVGPHVRAMRDATRGGMSAVLHEWAVASQLTMMIRERDIPLSPEVRGASEVLGLDPIHAANEGTFLAAVAPDYAEAALLALQSVRQTRNAARIGAVTARQIASVTIRRLLGRDQRLDEPSGTAFPRIC